MNFKLIRKGKELIKLPDYFHHHYPFKVYFLFPTEDYGKKGYAQIVVTKNIEICNKYSTIAELRNDFDTTCFDRDIIFIVDICEIRKYSENLLNTYCSFNKFIEKNINLFNISLKWLHPLQGDKFSALNSFYIRTVKITPFLFRMRYVIAIIFNFIIGTFKYPFFILIFIFDIFKYSFGGYIEYKKKKNDHNNIKKYAYMIAYPDTSEKKKDEIIDESSKILEKSKIEYLNSNNSLLTLLISIFGIIITLWISYQEINILKNENKKLNGINIENYIEIENLKNAMIDLKIKRNEFDINKLKENENNLNIIIEKEIELIHERLGELETKIYSNE
jgi:hypothetical protein